MRSLLFALLVPLAVACDGKPLTGPQAQRAVARAKNDRGMLASDALVFVDGMRVLSDSALRDLEPSTIESVEVLKGDAGRRYGVEGVHGVILITTKRAAAQHPPSR
jgi:outer membrane receptor for ferrienterochelin and colicin